MYHPQNLANILEGMAIRRLRFMYKINRTVYHIYNLCGTSETGPPPPPSFKRKISLLFNFFLTGFF